MRPVRIVGKVVGVMVVVALASLAFGYFVMTLWNWLIPGIFHGMGVINFWQAVGLLILARILFKGGGGHWGHNRWHRGWGGRGNDCGPGGRWGHWGGQWNNMSAEERQKMKDEWKGGWYEWKNKWHNMSPEDKEKMKAQWKDRCRSWDRRHPADILMKEDEEKTGGNAAQA